MKIAQIAPLIEKVPPKKYGGTERIIFDLTEELVGMGHDVTLFASGDSRTSARLISVYPKSLREARIDNLYGGNSWSMLNIGTAYSLADQFDIIHDHIGQMSLPTAHISKTPVVQTLHGAFSPASRRLYAVLDKPYLVTISKAQSKLTPNLNYIGNVHNGLKMGSFPFSKEHDGYLLYVGRISAEKGLHYAIEVAQYLDIPLIIAAKLDYAFKADAAYFKEYIEPRLSEQIKWIGEVDIDERNTLMSRAMCFLHPVIWEEPFGLTLIESMACGTPVIAFKRGSIPEVVEDGKSGYVVEDLEGMINAVINISKIDRAYCRKYVLKNFNSRKMALGYEKIYKKILESEKRKRPTIGEVIYPQNSLI